MPSLLSRTRELTWRELIYPRPLDQASAIERIHALACDPQAPLVALEVRATNHHVRFLGGVIAPWRCLLTLAQRTDTALTQIPRLLSDPTFRKSRVGAVANDPALGPFWAWYNAMTPEAQATIVAPLMNKLRALILKPSIRAVVGQRAPRFDNRTCRPLPRFAAEPSVAFLDHTLAIADVHAELVRAANAGTIELTEFVTEPACWRTYLNAGGGKETLKPDAFAVWARPGDQFETVAFIEVDMGTESAPRIRRKMRQYETYRATGIEQAAQGVWPIVEWVRGATHPQS